MNLPLYLRYLRYTPFEASTDNDNDDDDDTLHVTLQYNFVVQS